MNTLSPGTRALLDAARTSADPAPADHDRIRAALALKLAAGAGVTAVTASATAPPSASGTSAVLIKLALAVTVALVGGAVVWTMRSSNEPSPQVIAPAQPAAVAMVTPTPSAPGPRAPVAPDTVTSDLPVALPAPVARPARKPPTAVAVPTMPPIATLDAQIAALRAIRADLDHDAAATALTGLAAFARDFPSSPLAEEAAALRVTALCAAGRHADGLAAATAFSVRYPSSAHAARVARACTGGAHD